MKQHEVLYDWVIDQIASLASSSVTESFAEQLSEPALTEFVRVTEQLRTLGPEFAQFKSDQQHSSRWGELRQLVKSLQTQFGQFPGGDLAKLMLFSLFAEKLAASAVPLDTSDIDEAEFAIRELADPLPDPWFTRENQRSRIDSVAVFSCGDIDSVERALATGNISPPFALSLLAALSRTDQLPKTQAVLIRSDLLGADDAAIDAYIKILVLASGRVVHAPRCYSAKPSVLDQDAIVLGPGLEQWVDVISVLSEYNSRNEVLAKYLTLYHVIENFMFKRPIVELERQCGGRMLSIRDFRRLYQQVDMGEGEALRRLCDDLLRLDARVGVSYQSHINARWTGLVSAVSAGDLDSSLATLGVGFTYSQFQADTNAARFAKLVYLFRNAIVHNKETEFHLTYASLTPGILALLEAFLIPSLEEICFAVIGKVNNGLWYRNRELRLFG